MKAELDPIPDLAGKSEKKLISNPSLIPCSFKHAFTEGCSISISIVSVLFLSRQS